MDLNNSTESGPSTLQEFCKKLPKIVGFHWPTRSALWRLTFHQELHAHLSGSITSECLHKIWMQKKEAADQEGSRYDLEDPPVVIPNGKVGYDIVTYWPPF